MKKIISVLVFLTFFLGIFPTSGVLAETDNPTGFKFIHWTDTHIGHGPGNTNTSLVVSDILANHNDAAFLVHGGDVTEFGLPSQYEYYLNLVKPLTMPLYHTLGNHESRWTDAGKSIYKKYIGEPYASWNYQGVHFITLDSTITQGQHGHLDKAMLAWLKKDLANIDKNMPIIIFSHHPIFFDEAVDASKFMDNDWDLWPIIKDYNVVAIFTGHGHIDKLWYMNEVPVLMTKAVMDKTGTYSVVEINKASQEIVISEKSVDNPLLQEIARLPLYKSQTRPAVTITNPKKNEVLAGTFLLQATLANWSVPPQKVEYKLEDFSWKPLEKVGNVYQKEIDLEEVNDGLREFWVRAVAADGKVYLDKVRVQVKQSDKVEIAWEFEAEGGIQHAPALSNDYLYVGDNSGKVYQLDQKTGKKNWEFQTGGAVIGSPLYVPGKIYVSSTDGKVYCLKATNGQKLWEYQTGGAVLTAPVLAEGKIFVGSSDFNLYALNAENGQEIWRFATGNTIMHRVAYGEGTVFFGSWDQKFYAVDAETGEEKWQQALGSSAYYAPAASAPLYYEGNVFISTPSNKVYAFKGDTGEKVWEVSAASGLSSPVIFNGAIIYSTGSGTLYALDPETGENVWQAETNTSTYISSPLVQGGNIILNGLKGRLTAINIEDKQQSWAFNLGDTYLFSNGAVNGNLVFVGTLEGKLFALKAEPGAPAKPFPGIAAFTDIYGHWARKDLNKLASLGLMGGFKDGSFKPNDPLTRAQMASILSRYLQYEEPSESFASTFVDIEGHWANRPIMAMQEKNIIAGYLEQGKQLFKPEKQITRAEAVVMLARVLNLDKASDGFVSKFVDIEDHWAKDNIMALEEIGIIGGYEENGQMYFKPERNISRAEIGVLVVRVVENQ